MLFEHRVGVLASVILILDLFEQVIYRTFKHFRELLQGFKLNGFCPAVYQVIEVPVTRKPEVLIQPILGMVLFFKDGQNSELQHSDLPFWIIIQNY